MKGEGLIWRPSGKAGSLLADDLDRLVYLRKQETSTYSEHDYLFCFLGCAAGLWTLVSAGFFVRRNNGKSHQNPTCNQ